jgi:hypothetical protein
MELRKNSVREWVENKTLNVLHVSGRINPADIFTKEMRDGAHFRRLQDSFMCRLSNFLQQSLLVIYHQSQSTSHTTHRQMVADIFTKEMRDGAHFRRLQDSFMCRLSNFLQQSLLVIHHQSQSPSHTTHRQMVPSAASSNASFAQNSYFAVLFLFCGFVFHSHLLDDLSYFTPVEHWLSAYTTSSSHCSIRFALRFDITF